MQFREEDLYEPVCTLLKKLGYQIQSEIKNCDIAAKYEDDILIVELKKSFQLKLVYQAIERQAITDYVFVAIPRPKSQKTKAFQQMLTLLKQLKIGLITVALDSDLAFAQIVLEPESGARKKNRKKEQAFQKEFEQRSGVYNRGGIAKQKIVTAYREKSIELACILEKKQKVSIAQLRDFGLEEEQIKILFKNYYHWFERIQKGVYTLSFEGKKELENSQFHSIIEYYRKKYQKI